MNLNSWQLNVDDEDLERQDITSDREQTNMSLFNSQKYIYEAHSKMIKRTMAVTTTLYTSATTPHELFSRKTENNENLITKFLLVLFN